MVELRKSNRGRHCAETETQRRRDGVEGRREGVGSGEGVPLRSGGWVWGGDCAPPQKIFEVFLCERMHFSQRNFSNFHSHFCAPTISLLALTLISIKCVTWLANAELLVSDMWCPVTGTKTVPLADARNQWRGQTTTLGTSTAPLGNSSTAYSLRSRGPDPHYRSLASLVTMAWTQSKILAS